MAWLEFELAYNDVTVQRVKRELAPLFLFTDSNLKGVIINNA